MILQNFETKEEVIDKFRKIRSLSYQGVKNLEKLTEKERKYLGDDVVEMPTEILRLKKPDEAVHNTVCNNTADFFFSRLDPADYMYRHGILLTYNNIPFGIIKNWEQINMISAKTFYQKNSTSHTLFKSPIIRINHTQYTFPLVRGMIYAFDPESEDAVYQQFATRKFIENQWTHLEITKLKQPLVVAPLRLIAKHDFMKSYNFEKFEEYLSKEINPIPSENQLQTSYVNQDAVFR